MRRLGLRAADLLGRLVDTVSSSGDLGREGRDGDYLRSSRLRGRRDRRAERRRWTARHLRWAIATATATRSVPRRRSGSPEFDAVVDDLREALRAVAQALPTRRLVARQVPGPPRRSRTAPTERLASTFSPRPLGAPTSREAFDDIRDSAVVAIAGSDSPGGVELLMLAAGRVGGPGAMPPPGAWASAVETQIGFGSRPDLPVRRSNDRNPGEGAGRLTRTAGSSPRSSPRRVAWHEGGLGRTDLARDRGGPCARVGGSDPHPPSLGRADPYP